MTYGSRKFILALISIVVSSIGLFTGDLDGGTWVAAISFILGIYGTANVVEKKQ